MSSTLWVEPTRIEGSRRFPILCSKIEQKPIKSSNPYRLKKNRIWSFYGCRRTAKTLLPDRRAPTSSLRWDDYEDRSVRSRSCRSLMSLRPLPRGAGVMRSRLAGRTYPRSERYCRSAVCTTAVSDGLASWSRRQASTARSSSSFRVIVARFIRMS